MAPGSSVSLTHLKNLLLFETEADAREFALACGYQETSQGCISNKYAITDANKRNESLKKWIQTDNVYFLDALRGDKPRAYFMETPLFS